MPALARNEIPGFTLEDAWKEIQPVLQAVAAMNTDEYIEALRPYAILRFDLIRSNEEKIKSSEEFLTLARARKEQLPGDFKKLYAGLGLGASAPVKIGRKIRLAILDLDGMLAPQGEPISEATAKLIRELDATTDVRMAVVSEEIPALIKARVLDRVGGGLRNEIITVGYGGARNIPAEKKARLAAALSQSLGNRIEYISDAGYQLRVRLKSEADRPGRRPGMPRNTWISQA